MTGLYEISRLVLGYRQLCVKSTYAINSSLRHLFDIGNNVFYNTCLIFLNSLKKYNLILIVIIVVILAMISFCPAEHDGSKFYLMTKPILRLLSNLE